jgi:hypothetical protein
VATAERTGEWRRISRLRLLQRSTGERSGAARRS